MVAWITFPIIAALLWATVNHLDKYLLDKYCKNREIGGLMIFSSLIGIPVVLTIFVFNPAVINIDLRPALIITVAGALYILGLIPYLYALDIDETSVVAPQALMLTVFTGILGYVFLEENITFSQFSGIVLILAGALTLSLDIKSIYTLRLKLNVFLLMLISSFFIAGHIFLFKYFAIDLSFWKTVFWLHMGFILTSIVFLTFIRNYRNQFLSLIKTNPIGIISLNLVGEVLTVIGNLSSYYASLLAPLVISETVTEGIQPIFVLLIGILITIVFPNLKKENIGLKNLLHKTISITVMIFGLFLVLTN